MSKIPVTIENKAIIRFGTDDNYVNITLHRTLRIPDDGKVYPLPPSLGIFPVHKIDDYKDKVPKDWLKTGGVFFPMYQREAMWMQFSLYSKDGVRPKALKVAIGKVNAISGKPWKNEIVRGTEDYVIVPDQKWLDGINAGTGFIKQFVAMPLGSGYTVEGQVTGEEKFGGIQMICYDSKPKRSQYVRPKPKPKPIIYQPPVQPPYQPPYYPPPPNYPNYPAPAGGPGYYPPAPTMSGFAPQAQQSLGYKPVPKKSVRSSSKGFFAPPARGGRGGGGGYGRRGKSVKRKKKVSAWRSPPPAKESSSFKSRPQRKFEEERISMDDFGGVEKAKGQEMGISAGGKMKQKIIKDKYGYDSWDHSKFGRIYIRIVNSEMYESITGEKVPECPISTKTYQSYGYPWFDFYEEKEQDIKPSKILSKIKTVKEIDQSKNIKTNDGKSVPVTNVKKIPSTNPEIRNDLPVVAPVVPKIDVKKADPDAKKPPSGVVDDEDTKKKLAMLSKMGFEDESLNRFMLKQHGNIQKVVSLLVQFNSMK